MEIPNQLVSLYRHWPDHVDPPLAPSSSLPDLNTPLLSQIAKVIQERMRIWERKTSGEPEPWTQDRILQRFRFCNIYRELDRQTIEIHTLVHSLRDDFPLWLLNVVYARLVCNPNTVRTAGLLSFNKAHNERVYRRLQQLPSPKYGTAYIFPISVIQRTEYPTREAFFCLYLPQIIPRIANEIGMFRKEGVVDALARVLPLFGFTMRFHWTEVLIDVAYQYPEYIDLYKRFPIGPGSAPTMKLLNASADAEDVCRALVQYRPPGFSYLQYKEKPVVLSAENWEGIGCEFRKYFNLSKGKGRHRIYRN